MSDTFPTDATIQMKLQGTPIAVDFDGTCVTHEYPAIGRDIGAVPILKRMVSAGAKIILWTMRSGLQLGEAVEWFNKNDIPLFGIQRNPTQDSWTESPKAYAKIYIDDAALGCPLLSGEKGERPYVDWKTIEEMIFTENGTQTANSDGSVV